MQHSRCGKSQAGISNPDPALRALERLVGAWRLQSIVHDDGQSQAVVEGLIIYDAGGFMSAQIISGGISGFPDYHSYFGTFGFDAAAAAITHHRIANNNLDAPTDVERNFHFVSDDVLVLSPEGQGVELTFQRAVS